jgi:type IV secretory pathway TrbL component
MNNANPFEASGFKLWFGGFVSMFLWSLLIIYISFRATRIAGGLVSGTPTLGAGGAVKMVMAGAVAGVAAAGGVANVATGGASIPVTGAINKGMENLKAATHVATND